MPPEESDLIDQYDQLRQETSAYSRGKALERLLKRILRKDHFHVEDNPRIAKPRQTDLLAKDQTRTYLVEAKSQRRPATVADIDALFTRLDSTASSVVGVLVSLAGFSTTAIERVESKRQRSILLITGHELEDVLAPDLGLKRVLERKFDALLTHGKALIDESDSSFAIESARRLSITRGPRRFLLPDGSRVDSLRCRGGFGSFVFVQSLVDIDWVTAGGAGVTLDLAVTLEGPQTMAKVVEELEAIGWATDAGHWTISQAEVNWHGFGARSLVSAIEDWRTRYQEAGRIHHTEQVVYYDKCEGGFYTIVASIDARTRVAWPIDLSFQLVGVPLDQTPFRQLYQSLEIQTPSYVRPRVEKSVSNKHFLRDSWKPLAAKALVVQTEIWPDGNSEDWVGGIVVENPFSREKAPSNPRAEDWWPWSLSESELVVCSLSSWHTVGDRHGGYYMKRVEWAWSSDALVFCAIADWADPKPKARAPSARRARSRTVGRARTGQRRTPAVG